MNYDELEGRVIALETFIQAITISAPSALSGVASTFDDLVSNQKNIPSSTVLDAFLKSAATIQDHLPFESE